MMSWPDLEQKKLVFIPNQGDLEQNIRFSNMNISLFREGRPVHKVSTHLVLSLFVVGETTLTSGLIRKAKSFGVSLYLLNRSLQSYAALLPLAEGNYALREKQYLMDEPRELDFARHLIQNKVRNQYRLLKRFRKEKGAEDCAALLRRIGLCSERESLLGLEGNASARYFPQVFDSLEWRRRAPRTKEDIPNVLLDIGYTYLFNFVDTLLSLFGFDTYKGVYHQHFFQRKSLVCDLMEPMRPVIDFQLVKMQHLGQVKEDDFSFEQGGFKLKRGKSQGYSTPWFRVLMQHKKEMYQFVVGYYRHLQNPARYPFPVFTPHF